MAIKQQNPGFYTLLMGVWASLIAQLVKNLPAMQETWVWTWVGKIHWRRERLPTPVFWPGEFHGLYNPWGHKESDMTERLPLHLNRAYQVAQWHRIFLPMQEMQETQVQSLLGEDPLEKEMATQPTILAWKIPWTKEPGGLQFMQSQRVRHDWVTNIIQCEYRLTWKAHVYFTQPCDGN